jgi:GNAT superfamily N-acetyltransferase
MYTHPDCARQGVGRLTLMLCEAAARAEGLMMLEIVSTPAGEPLYRTAGFESVEHVTERAGGAPVPLVRMRKVLPLPPV